MRDPCFILRVLPSVLSVAVVMGLTEAKATERNAAAIAGETAPRAALAYDVKVTVRDGLVRLDAHGVPLATVLEAVTEAAGIAMTLYGDPTVARSSWQLTDVPVEEALRTLAGRNSYVLHSDGQGGRMFRVYGRRSVELPGGRRAWALTNVHHPDPRIRSAAVRALSGDGEATTLSLLHAMLREDETPSVRCEAVLALNAMAGQDALEAMSDGLGDPDATVREQLISVLAERSEVPATMALGQSYYTETEPVLRLKVVQSLASQQTPAAFALLEAALQDDDEDIRRAAWRLLETRR